MGIRACLAGHRVIFKTATEWVAFLADAQRQGRLDDELRRLERIPLLVCDEEPQRRQLPPPRQRPRPPPRPTQRRNRLTHTPRRPPRGPQNASQRADPGPAGPNVPIRPPSDTRAGDITLRSPTARCGRRRRGHHPADAITRRTALHPAPSHQGGQFSTGATGSILNRLCSLKSRFGVG
ncbi:MAG: ATP-binding protein [Pseudonocardiaceae bacterium]